MPPPAPFWLCHECGAQMRPVMVDGVSHCASCNGEFIEILDSEVNPDPFHELPPPPPTRPNQSQLSPSRNTPQSPSRQYADPGQGGQSFFSSFIGNILGAAADHSQGEGSNSSRQDQGRETSPTRNTGGSGTGSGRTFSFNFPGGGRGQVMFGSFNGAGMGGMGGMGPFGPIGQGRTTGGMGFESLFPQGFGPPPRAGSGQHGRPHPLGPGDPMDGGELLRALMAVMGEEGQMGPGMFFGGPGRGNLGDYATSEQGFNDILERLMQAAGPQGPLPASDIVINGLPRFKFDEEKKLAQSTYKDCPVCKDDFAIGDEVVRIPCAHIFHPDCLIPWLKQNGSCPVCRFSLVPEEEDRARRSAAPPQSNTTSAEGTANSAQEGSQSTMTSILNRLFGQAGGTTSNPTSPTGEESNHLPFGAAGEATRPAPSTTAVQAASSGDVSRPRSVPDGMPPTDQSGQQSGSSSRQHNNEDPPSPTLPASGQPSLSTAIPEDYRARHRERERQRQQHEDTEG
ncbi:uncharacterized protein I206_105494 [Kwoniella pini CBS 10737]